MLNFCFATTTHSIFRKFYEALPFARFAAVLQAPPKLIRRCMQDFSPRQIGDLIEVLSFYILRFEEAFCLGAGNAVHIDVAGAQKRQVAVSHIQLKARQVGVCTVSKDRKG